MARNPFTPASRAALLLRMEQDGCETFADKVRWVKRHIPSITTPAAFVAALVDGAGVRNPPDPEYSLELGEGAFSQAVGKPDPHKDYFLALGERGRPVAVDRSPAAVEVVTKLQVDAGEEEWGDPEGVDASKTIMLLAREALKGDKKALAYLPDLKPVRIDRTDPDAPELVVAMPYYRVMDELAPDEKPRLARELARCLSSRVTGEGLLTQTIARFTDAARTRGIPELSREIPVVVKVLTTLHQIAAGMRLSKNRSDLHDGNLAVGTDGHLIILDPMVAEAKWAEVESIWRKHGWDKGAAKRNPPQPDLFRAGPETTVDKQELVKRRPWAEEAVTLIQTAYAPIGGHANLRTVEDLERDDADVYRFADIDADLEPDVLQVSKTTPYGFKTVAMGHDGTREARRQSIVGKIEDFRTFGNYGEVSGRLAEIVLEAGVPVVGDQRVVEKVLGKKVDWVGMDPERPGVYGWYERMLGGHKHRKILVGLPDLFKNPAMAPLASTLSPTQQRKYLGGLKGKAREARAAEILYLREHRSDEPFATDVGQQTKPSSHAKAFAAQYGRAPADTADAAKLSGVRKSILDKDYARGMAAWQTGHRPGASQHAWAMARVESFLTGGPTSQTADADLAREAGLTQNPAPAADQTQSAEFKRWFGNSKVVDKNGKPLVVYHGTKGNFTIFSPERVGQSDFGSLGRGYYFSEHRDLAEMYATLCFGSDAPKVLSVYLKIENPIYYEDLPYIGSLERSKVVTKGLIDAGYDGVIKYDREGKIVEVVAFEPTQIKSATGNRGTFDPSDPDIRNPSEPTWIPPADVAEAARRGLELRGSQPPSNRCCTPVGIARAKQLANRQPVSETTVRRMKAYFDRHYGPDSRGKGWGTTSKGWQAHLCWGGDPGMAWAQKVLAGKIPPQSAPRRIPGGR